MVQTECLYPSRVRADDLIVASGLKVSQFGGLAGGWLLGVDSGFLAILNYPGGSSLTAQSGSVVFRIASPWS